MRHIFRINYRLPKFLLALIFFYGFNADTKLFGMESSLLQFNSKDYSSLLDQDFFEKNPVFKNSCTIRVLDNTSIKQLGYKNLREIVGHISKANDPNDLKAMKAVYGPTGNIEFKPYEDVLFLVNGKPMWDKKSIAKDAILDQTQPSDITRIEVLWSSVVVYYGLEKYQGLINIVLKTTPKLGEARMLDKQNPFSDAILFNSEGEKNDKKKVYFSEKSDNLALLLLIFAPLFFVRI